MGEGAVSAWEKARRDTVVEDDAQRQLVSLLVQPITAADTPGQARRRDAMGRLVVGMPPPAADRLHTRLSDARDPLGQLFQLELHRQTRRSVLGLLDAQRRGFDRGTAPTTRGTDERKVAPIPELSKPTQKTSPGDPGAIAWPKWPKQDPSDLLKRWRLPSTDPIVRVPQPGPVIKNWKPDGPGWIGRTLSTVASGFAMVLAGGVSLAAAAKGLEAAWIVFQTSEGMRLTGVVGKATEEALIAMVGDQFGLPPHLVKNLNDVVTNFPVFDTLVPVLPPINCKGYGVLTMTPFTNPVDQADFFGRGLASEYLGMAGLDTTTLKKNARAAQHLFDHRNQLQKEGVWPKGLKATSVEGIQKYLQNNGLLATLSDHVEATKAILRRRLETMRDNGQLANVHNVTVPKGQWKQWVKSHTDRIISVGIDSDDLADIIQKAKALPTLQAGELQELIQDFETGKRRRQKTR